MLWGSLNAFIAPLAYFMAGRLHGGAAWSADEHAAAPPVDDALDRGVEWNSSWMRWFTPMIVLLLLAVEWWLRRRNGME